MAVSNIIAGIGRYVHQVFDELRKTVSPSAREWMTWAIAAFLFVLLLMGFVSVSDYGLGRLTLWLFG